MQNNFNIFNSITKQIVELKLNNITTWYSCGPTIYDDSHLGHARNYITFDMIRRILLHYNYDINYLLNITDIDDKIINKIKELNNNNINDDIYYNFIKRMEKDFFNDMDNLNIKRPNITTRVSENIDNIISYVQTIIDNGFAYYSNGSIYIDTTNMINKGYNIRPLLDGFKEIDENNLQNIKNSFNSEKKSANDFALWKAEKGGEISFPSRWIINGVIIYSRGRPAWHIECSAIIRNIFGSKIDIHTGGIDLLYPHHNNEIVQELAFKNDNTTTSDWINYFIHSGPLTVDGIKMSKSLNNYITIKDYLKNNTADSLRLLFLRHNWSKPLDYNQKIKKENDIIYKKLLEFINHIQFVKENSKIKNTLQDSDNEYYQKFINIKVNCNNFIKNNFNTAQVFKQIFDLIKITYNYLETDYNITFIDAVLDFIMQQLDMFGFMINTTKVNSNNDTTNDKIIKMSVELRNDIRNLLIKERKTIDNNVLGQFYNILDDFRDNKLASVNIKLQDVNNKSKIVN